MERDDILKRFNDYISRKALEGYIVVDKNESTFTAVLSKPAKKVNHVLHGLLTLFTCVWGIVWIIVANNAKHDSRIRVSFDSSGNLVEEKMKG